MIKYKEYPKTYEVYIIINNHHKRAIWLWKGTESSVRKKFIGAQTSQDLRGKIGLDYSVVPINEGKEPSDFFKLIEANYIVVGTIMEKMILMITISHNHLTKIIFKCSISKSMLSD